jgi:hypothetical protein
MATDDFTHLSAGGTTAPTPQAGNLLQILERVERALNLDERGDAANLVANAKQLLTASRGGLLERVRDVGVSIDAADSLSSVAALALRAQDCDIDRAVADVLQDSVYPQLRAARDALDAVEKLIASQEVSHA